MKFSLITIVAVIVFSSCAQTQTSGLKIPLGSKQKTANEAVATFSEGCFWHAEIVFQSLEGVRDAVSGYAGGKDSSPDYEKVSTGSTGHAETVQVYYDPSKISYETLVKALFASMDPTQVNGQGNDVGTEYRSIAFYRNENEKKIIEAEIKRLTDAKVYKNKIVTEVVPFKSFYPAEDFHQEYIYNNPQNPYVRNVSIPEFLHFKKVFNGKFKP
ncbi:MAG: peptide-methionine (S)-S-oxide reductase MsrA [Bacteroidota bacterium]